MVFLKIKKFEVVDDIPKEPLNGYSIRTPVKIVLFHRCCYDTMVKWCLKVYSQILMGWPIGEMHSFPIPGEDWNLSTCLPSAFPLCIPKRIDKISRLMKSCVTSSFYGALVNITYQQAHTYFQ